jgi:hypothetical protein
MVARARNFDPSPFLLQHRLHTLRIRPAHLQQRDTGGNGAAVLDPPGWAQEVRIATAALIGPAKALRALLRAAETG